MKDFSDKTAVITGAGSGIGRHLAIQLADAGTRVILADVDEKGAAGTQQMIIDAEGNCHYFNVDVSRRQEVYGFARSVADQFGQVDILINNAGVALGQLSVEEVEYEELKWILGVNLWGVIYGTKAFLPYLKARPEAVIANVSSVFGLVGVATQSPYCMTKFAVRAFTESLRAEMIDTPLQIVQIHPGGIKTNIVRNARFRDSGKDSQGNTGHRTRENLIEYFDKNARTSPEKAARIIIRGIRKGKNRILVGPDAHLMDKLLRLFPNRALRLMAKRAQRARSQQHI